MDNKTTQNIFDMNFMNNFHLCLYRPTNYEPNEKVTVSNMEFYRRLNTKIGDLFDDNFDWSGVMIAGGLISGLMEKKAEMKEYEKSDIDIFVYDPESNKNRIINKMIQIYNYFVDKLEKKFYAYIMVPNSTIMTIIIPGKCSIQVIGTLYKSEMQILKSFDLTHCQIGFNGNGLVFTEDFIEAIRSKITKINTNCIDLYRLVKAYRRGYSIHKHSNCGIINVIRDHYASNDSEEISYYKYCDINQLSSLFNEIINDPVVNHNLMKNYIPTKLPSSIEEAQQEMEKIGEAYVGKNKYLIINNCNTSIFINKLDDKFGFVQTFSPKSMD
ncbi:MAG: hypothetical protein Satyrvirus8_8 [Satyrvirus sp.]|uniref:Uncharacterized protein n=1 Tax=Satyrvirus sp. TaxID=2487771 RepID=A0A3G5ADJ4_9VIRU|nr:MAG: hypothetical protein Satyrvirus8_8 [Satyrvirus sp.]